MFDLFEQFDGTPKLNEEDSLNSNDSFNEDTKGSEFNFSSIKEKKVFVLSVGGSVFFSNKVDAPKIAKFCEVINSLKREGFVFVIVVGGGSIARTYQAGARVLGANNFELDEVGIQLTRANASLFTLLIKDAWSQVLVDVHKARNVLLLGKTPVFGGTVPGQSTDAVAALLTEMLGGVFVNLSNVDGIFNKDPNKEDSAKLFEELSHNKMVSLLKASASKPGAHSFVDPFAASILQRSKLTSFFVNGNDLDNFINCVRGNEFRGTILRTLSPPSPLNEKKVE